MFAGGLRVKGSLPWLRGKTHAWIFAGLGYAAVSARSYPLADDGRVRGSGGGHFEVPVGLGLGYRFHRPWELTLEVGSRFGFGFAGSVYGGRYAEAPGGARSRLAPLGSDTLAPFAVLGVSLDL